MQSSSEIPKDTPAFFQSQRWYKMKSDVEAYQEFLGEEKPVDASRIHVIKDGGPLTNYLGLPERYSRLIMDGFGSDVSLVFNFDKQACEGRVGLSISYTACFLPYYRCITPVEYASNPGEAHFLSKAYTELAISQQCPQGNEVQPSVKEIRVTMHPDFAVTPTKIVLSTCRGRCLIRGLDEAEIAKRFEVYGKNLNIAIEAPAAKLAVK